MYAIGISWNDFWRLNPRIVKLIVKGYREEEEQKLREKNLIAHLQGKYFAEAILSTVCNMLSSKSSKKYEYPEKPYDLYNKEQDLTEEKLQKQRELFVTKLMLMQTNYELNHKNDSVS